MEIQPTFLSSMMERWADRFLRGFLQTAAYFDGSASKSIWGA